MGDTNDSPVKAPTATSPQPKLRDVGAIALEALGKIDTVLAFDLSVMNDYMKSMYE
jgi:hypothetical protein